MESGGLVYVCDDTEPIRRLIRVNLELEGYRVVEAADGGALLELLASADELPGVVTLDAHMEPRDGWWAIARIRGERRYRDIPVVMVTASVHQLDRAQANGSGIDAFVAKPFEPDDLVDLVGRFMASGRGTAPAP